MKKSTHASSTARHAATAELPQNIRCAVRFPLALPVVLSTQTGEHPALTRNVSASGVLFDLQSALNVGQDIRFAMKMPGGALGSEHDVMVRCSGRVVRCSPSQGHYHAAATIDEYQFVEK
jgi:hypothetical protein